MNRDQREELHRALVILKEEFEALLGSAGEQAKPVDLDAPMGRLSRMDAMQQQSMAKANRETAKRRLQQIEAALLRFANDDYGECRECEEPIGFARLKASPESLFCRNCQEQREDRA